MLCWDYPTYRVTTTMGKTKNKFYAYYLKHNLEKGIVSSWNECKSIVDGKQGAMYKGFKTEADAEKWLENPQYSKRKNHGEQNNIHQNSSLPKGVYWDAGTGGGRGVEVRVTDESGTPLLFKIAEPQTLTKEGNFNMNKGETNNYGELVGIYAALKIALKLGEQTILGDSKLVIDYWSKGRVNRKNVTDTKTISLAEKVTTMRKNFEANGGKVEYISGDNNPADLGFHRKK